jgi:hypothetical protein
MNLTPEDFGVPSSPSEHARHVAAVLNSSADVTTGQPLP